LELTTTPTDARQPTEIAGATKLLLVVLSAAAGIIHLAMVPSHWGESVIEGLGFALVGWAQLALAVVLFVRPTPTVVRAGMVATYAFLAVWVVSRVWGLPFGEHSGHPHDPSFVDLACVGIEVAFVVVAGAVLVRPRLGAKQTRAWSAAMAVASIAVLVLATAALASPSARNHADSSHAGHSHSESDEVAGGTTAHQHAVSTADVKSGWTALGENGHQHGSGLTDLDDATQAQLSVQLAPTAQLVAKYPTLADAEAAGYRRAGRFNPGLGVHYGAFGRGADGAITGVNGEVMVPQLIYDGTDPGSPLAGFMYMADAPEGAVPEGFVGSNDHWHYHSKLCIKIGSEGIKVLLPGDENVTAAECAAVQGMYVGQSGYMVHVWTVPGYESDEGVFSGLNRKLTCPDGTYHTARGEGSKDSTCASAVTKASSTPS
jgi:hypothetical protein